MAIKEYFTFPKAPALLEPHHRIIFCVISRTLVGVLPFCRDAVSVFYSPSQLGHCDRWHYYRRQNCKRWCGSTKVLSKEGQCVLIRHGGALYRRHPCHLMKANKEFGNPRYDGNKGLGSPRYDGNKTAKILREEDEGDHNKSLHINMGELKDNSKELSKGKVVEYRMKWWVENRKDYECTT